MNKEEIVKELELIYHLAGKSTQRAIQIDIEKLIARIEPDSLLSSPAAGLPTSEQIIKASIEWFDPERCDSFNNDKESFQSGANWVIDWLRSRLKEGGGENKKLYDREHFMTDMEDIMFENYNKFMGTNEAELFNREEIADLVEQIFLINPPATSNKQKTQPPVS